MKGGTLFSGIGAPELAAPEIGWRWCAEIDPFASAVLAERFPEALNLGDVTQVDWDAVEPVDIIVWGSPCQSFSVAGKRAGLDDPRGNLALIGLQIVDRVRPRWVVFENVPGLLSSDEWRDFGAFLGALGQCGYGFAYRVLDAQYFGVPQRRRRVFVVGHLGDWRPAAAVLFEPESLSWNSPPRREAWQDVARPIASCAPGGSGYRADSDTAENLIAPPITSNPYGDHESREGLLIAKPLGAHKGGRRQDLDNETYVAYGIRSDASRAGAALTPSPDAEGRVRLRDPGFTIHEELAPTVDAGQPHAVAYGINSDTWSRSGTAQTPSPDAEGRVGLRDPGFGIHEELAPSIHASLPHAVAYGGNRQSGPIDVATAVRAKGGTGHGDFESETFVAVDLRNGALDEVPMSLQGGGMGEERTRAEGRNFELQDGLAFDVADPISAHEQRTYTHEGRNNFRLRNVVGTMAVRRLTPRECERLQGFPDDFTLIRYNGKLAADGPRYRALGNAMAVPVIGWILRRVTECNRREQEAAA